VVFLSTGADLLDLVVGGGVGDGYPEGKIVNLVGDKSSGKTFLACEVIAAGVHRLKEKFKWAYDDCESGFTHDTKALYGVQIIPKDPKQRRRSRTVEDLYGNVRQFCGTLGKDEVGIYVCDSLDGLTSVAGMKRADARYDAFEKEAEFKEGSYMMDKAKFLSQEFFPQVAEFIETQRCLLIIISQVRDNIEGGMFEAKYVRAGGKAMDFYCHTVMWLAQQTKILTKGRAVGAVVKAKTTKSKTPRPFRECSFSFLFDYGLDNVGSNLDFLFDLRGDSGLLLKTAQEIVWKGKPQTVENLTDFIVENGHEGAFKEKYRNWKKSDMLAFIGATPALEALFVDTFGFPRTREELIDYIEEKGLQDELTERVVEKWEALEDAVRTKRAPKYAGA
jgi:recombination protein RecA